MKLQQKLDGKLDLSALIMVNKSACLLIPSLNTQGPPIVFTIKFGENNKILRRNPISYRGVYLWCLFYEPYLATHQSNFKKSELKKKKQNNRITPA